MTEHRTFLALTIFNSCFALLLAPANAAGDDPVGLRQHHAGPHRVETMTSIVLKDETRKKELPVRVSFPKADGQFPLIVWSHGMYGSKDGYQPLVSHWVSHGYVVIQPTHSDSLSLDNDEN